METISGLAGRLANRLGREIPWAGFYAGEAGVPAWERLGCATGLLRLAKLTVRDGAMGDLLAGADGEGRPVYGKRAEVLLTLTLSAPELEGENGLEELFAAAAESLLFGGEAAASALSRGAVEYDVKRELWRMELSVKTETLLIREDTPLWTAAALSAGLSGA